MIKATVMIKSGYEKRFEKLVENFCSVNHDNAAAIVVDSVEIAVMPKKGD
jgi:hypothetical protein